jgi:hypothetical protein
MEEKKMIYGITYRSYEFDDLGYPDFTPIKFYSTKEKRDNAFKELVSEKLAWFEKCKNSEYTRTEDYEIGENTIDDFLELAMGKWCYEWCKKEFEFVE